MPETRHLDLACRRRRRTPAAFTLVELLVVIGIIALLVGILLPTLSRARESANSVKCASNMRQAATGMILYANENDGWLAGPHTSGRIWNYSPNADGNNYGGDSIDPGEESSPSTPTQNMDWMSPTLGPLLDDLPENDLARLRRLFTSELNCPSVSQDNSRFVDEGGSATTGGFNANDVPYGSYAAVIQFHALPRLDHGGDQTTDTGEDERVGISALLYNGNSYRGARLQDGYAPKITRVGGATEKAYLIEGPRFIEMSEVGGDLQVSNISFNPFRYQRQGGNFMARGPYLSYDRQPHRLPTTNGFNPGNWLVGQLSSPAQTLGWRHADATMNLAFFDGHVERRGVADSIQPSLYLPRGAEVTQPELTYVDDGTERYRID